MDVAVPALRSCYCATVGLLGLLTASACTGQVSGPAQHNDESPEPAKQEQPGATPGKGMDGTITPIPAGTPGVWVGPQPFRRIGNDEFMWSTLDLLGQAQNTALAEAIHKGMPLEALGEHGFPAAGALGTLDVQVLLDKAKLASASVDFSTKVQGQPLVACTAAPASATAENACAQATLQTLATRAYRRPVASDETKDLLQSFADARQASGATFLSALRTAIASVLTAPSFLYHDEALADVAETKTTTGGNVVALSDHELAGRLAATLWRSVPDQSLLAAAAKRGLRTDEGIKLEVERMLADPRSERGLVAFFDEITETGTLAALPRTATGGTWNAAVANELHKGMHDLIRRVVLQGDGRYETLIEQGLLSTGAVMAAQSTSHEASPIKRGKLIRANFLCQPIPAPPPDIPALPEPSKTTATGRNRFIEHSRNPKCVGCHERMDPIGFAFSNFDQIGRATNANEDTSGQVVDLDGVNAKFSNLAGLTSLVARSQQARSCFVRQWARFALGRQMDEKDEPGLEALASRFDVAKGDIRDLFQGLLQSTAFRTQEIN